MEKNDVIISSHQNRENRAMSLPVHSSSLFLPHKPLISSPRPTITTTASTINCQKPSSELTPDESSTTPSSSSSAAGVGFGSTKQQKNTSTSGKRQRAAVIRRRPPVEQPNLVSKPNTESGGNEAERGRTESDFILTWFGLGAVILAQGLTLAASGFLPEEWDRLIVKYVYPIFTPTVGLFVAGSVAYGAVKYLQNDLLNK